jgi:hypothetical protein
MNTQRFTIVQGTWAVARLPARAAIPPWAMTGDEFVSITRTKDELSVICPEAVLPRDIQAERGWAILKVLGPFPFSQLGILAAFASPLAAGGISLLAIATFDTDYILVKSADLAAACALLTAAGHEHVTANRR